MSLNIKESINKYKRELEQRLAEANKIELIHDKDLIDELYAKKLVNEQIIPKLNLNKLNYMVFTKEVENRNLEFFISLLKELISKTQINIKDFYTYFHFGGRAKINDECSFSMHSYIHAIIRDCYTEIWTRED